MREHVVQLPGDAQPLLVGAAPFRTGPLGPLARPLLTADAGQFGHREKGHHPGGDDDLLGPGGRVVPGGGSHRYRRWTSSRCPAQSVPIAAQAAYRRPETTAVKQATATVRNTGPYGYPAPRYTSTAATVPPSTATGCRHRHSSSAPDTNSSTRPHGSRAARSPAWAWSAKPEPIITKAVSSTVEGHGHRARRADSRSSSRSAARRLHPGGPCRHHRGGPPGPHASGAPVRGPRCSSMSATLDAVSRRWRRPDGVITGTPGEVRTPWRGCGCGTGGGGLWDAVRRRAPGCPASRQRRRRCPPAGRRAPGTRLRVTAMPVRAQYTDGPSGARRRPTTTPLGRARSRESGAGNHAEGRRHACSGRTSIGVGRPRGAVRHRPPGGAGDRQPRPARAHRAQGAGFRPRDTGTPDPTKGARGTQPGIIGPTHLRRRRRPAAIPPCGPARRPCGGRTRPVPPRSG